MPEQAERPDVRQAALLALLQHGGVHGPEALSGLAAFLADPEALAAALGDDDASDFAEGEHPWEESKHARNRGKFAKKGGGQSGPDGSKLARVRDAKRERAWKRKGKPDEPAAGEGGADWSAITGQRSKLVEAAGNPEKAREERDPLIKHALETAKATGAGLSWMGRALYGKLPGFLRKTVDGCVALYGMVDHAMESVKHLTQQVAVQVAHERGLGEKHVKAVARGVQLFDGLSAWTANIPIAHDALHHAHIEGWTGFWMAKIGYLMPTASLMYCAYSGIRNPLALMRAAGKVAMSKIPGAEHLAHSIPEIGHLAVTHDAHPGEGKTREIAAGKHGPVRVKEQRGAKVHAHAEEGDGQLAGKELVGVLLERLDDAGDGAEWYYALFCAAFDLTHDTRKSLSSADAAFEEHPSGDELAEHVTAGEIGEWLDDYTPPALEEDHEDHAADDSVSILTAAPKDVTKLSDYDRAEALLSERLAGDRDALVDITHWAARRFAEAGGKGKLFTDDERNHVAGILAGTLAAGDLTGRARIRRRVEQAQARDPDAATSFADEPTDWGPVEEVLAGQEPEEALDYFRRLVPTLGIDPQRWREDLERRAFTLAAATEEQLLRTVQDCIQRGLQSGDVAGTKKGVQAALDAAGLTPENPSYADLIVRTNLMDAYNAGAQREMDDPDVADLFPVWRYSNPKDSRSRPKHAALAGRYYDRSVKFAEVRGTDIVDLARCRCTMVPIDRDSWRELAERGASLDVFAEAPHDEPASP